jgi:CheY-like chemotaxis protein
MPLTPCELRWNHAARRSHWHKLASWKNFELIHALRNSSETRHCKLIALTRAESKQHVQMLRRIGMEALVGPAMDKTYLARAIDEANATPQYGS